MARAAGWPRGHLPRLLVAAAGFALMAPPGLVALPVALLGLGRGSAGGWRTIWGGAFVGIAAAWLVWPGDLPSQTMRAGALLGTVTFVLLADRTRWSVTHRALAAAGAAVAGTALLYASLGWSWDLLHWWVEYRTGFMLRVVMGGFQTQLLSLDAQVRFAETMDGVVRWTADAWPALGTVQLLVGLALASALHGRLSATPRGRPPARIREFRFSEHWGWLFVLGLAGVLLAPQAGTPRLVAVNLLTLGAALFLARGGAVVVFLWARRGGARWVAAVAAVTVVFLMPVVLGALLALGVLDAGLDLRRRATASPPNQ